MDGTLRNVIVVFFSFPALQGPETLVFAAFLIGAKHMDSSVCPGHTVRMYNPGKPDESSRRKASKRTAAYYDL